MELDRIDAVVRPRNTWESIDLGFNLVQAWRLPLFKVWLSFFIPLTLVIYTLSYGFSTFLIGWLVFWWLKPLFDRILLFFLSRALFGEQPTVWQTFQALPHLLLKTRLLYALTFGRVTLIRSLLLPIWQLEGLKGKTRKKREKLLQRYTRGTAVWLTIVCWHFEGILMFSLYGLWYLMMPVSYQFDIFELLFSEPFTPWLEIVNLVFIAITVSIIEPLYVAGGFILYLNRRTHLEGWDIELAFRRMAERLSTEKS